jgi:hypothetical protein
MGDMEGRTILGALSCGRSRLGMPGIGGLGSKEATEGLVVLLKLPVRSTTVTTYSTLQAYSNSVQGTQELLSEMGPRLGLGSEDRTRENSRAAYRARGETEAAQTAWMESIQCVPLAERETRVSLSPFGHQKLD